MKFLFLLLLSFSSLAFAQRAKVLIVDPDIDTTELKDYKIERPELGYSLPDREEREDLFVGFDAVKNYDELQRDILFMDLKSKTLKELKKKYPELLLSDLKKMKERR